MPRTVRDARLETRAARERLAERHEPYWRAIGPGAAIGYRKAPKGGRWYARWRALNERSGGGYRKEALGTADDVRDANGLDVLGYQQATRKAHAFFDRCAREHLGLAAPAEVGTVADAVRLYLAWFESDRRSYRETKGSAERHILPKLGGVEIQKLSPLRIRAWRDEFAASAPLGRGGKPIRRLAQVDPEEEARRRKVTANRVLVILKAALEHAHREHGAGIPEAWRRVQPFQGVDAARQRWPDRDECVRLLNACEPDFRALVRGALETGARYEELTRLRVADFRRDGPSVLVAPGKSGKARQVPLDADGAAFFAALAAGRAGDAPLFLTADGRAWARDAQIRRMRAVSERASVRPPVNFHSFRHAYASLRIMNGAPLAVVAAALGHSTTRMVERHYGHLAPSFVRTTIEGTGLGLGAEAGTVVLMPAARPRVVKIRPARREPAG